MKPSATSPHRRPTRQRKGKPATDSTQTERINRYLARCGLCSRREADRWIVAGRVTLNGVPITTLGVQVGSRDVVTVDGKKVTPNTSYTYLLYHKPDGLLCARSDPRGRPLIYDMLEIAPNVQSVGRLDMDSEGLLLLTDDGGLAQTLMRPEFAVEREYRVRITGHLALASMQRLRAGDIDLGDGEQSAPWRLVVDAETGGHSWITVTLTRGHWREVRRTLEAVGHTVRRLIRTRFGPLKLDETLPRGALRPLNTNEKRHLRGVGKRPEPA
ncbi:MAG: pseudouridine synthase [Mariprofundales bacterium]|nr:pseudouridine synthase [Mariprofundales bacterium]